jgi:FtsP/CotA-like multicopper oxidase with cupredoxin domain
VIPALRAGLSAALLFGILGTAPVPGDMMPTVAANDNRAPAGILSNGTLNLSLEARVGNWSPDGPGTAGTPIEAFGEPGKPLQIPGPLVRVPSGTTVVARVRNAVPGTVLAMHGMADRPAAAGDRIVNIPFGQERELRFRAGAPGTYYYWGSTTGQSVVTRLGADSQLVGALVVDDPHKAWDRNNDRTLVFSEWDGVVDAKKNIDFKYVVLAINGRRYPATERLSYVRGSHVTWHIINASSEDHPLHLHGFYFDVASVGDGFRDVEYSGYREKGVTELFPAGGTKTLVFNADRAGNWMFHCHIAYHIVRYLPLGWRSTTNGPTEEQMGRMAAMGGMILRFKVVPKPSDGAADPAPVARRIGLLVEPVPSAPPKLPAFRYEIRDGSSTLDGTGNVGPAMILTQGQMTAIAITNQLDEPTAVHWHGIEQHNAYYDGVPGYSGYGKKLEPMIAPGASFEARFAPPRAGTFIYHTHVNDIWQLRGGLSGPLIVLPPGARFDTATDHVVQMTSTQDVDDFDWFNVNGTRNPAAMTIVAGVPNRFRFINMTTFHPDMVVSLLSGGRTAGWTPVARDGADIPPTAQSVQTAIQTITIGQTRDYLFTAPAPGEYRLLFWGYSGDKLRAELPIHVIAAAVAKP